MTPEPLEPDQDDEDDELSPEDQAFWEKLEPLLVEHLRREREDEERVRRRLLGHLAKDHPEHPWLKEETEDRA